jgi:hypothetical protein
MGGNRMITVNKGRTLISGNFAEITQDFCSVINALMSEAPEILVAVEGKYADDTCALLSTNINHDKVAIAGDIALDFRECNKEND